MADDTTTPQSPFHAYPGFVIVTPYEEAQKGVMVADTLKKSDQAGLVLEVGDDCPNAYGTMMTCHAQKGDVIVHKTYYGAPYVLDNKEYKFISFADIVATLK